MHDDIIKYSISGEMSDANIFERQESLIRFLESRMKDLGVCPSLDLDPQFTMSYSEKSQAFDFKLTIYGIFVGKGEAWQASGVSNGKVVGKSIPLPKSPLS